jgi:WD40-like Beta Propeller Repeat
MRPPLREGVSVSAARLLPLLCIVLAFGAVSAANATNPGPNGRIAFARDDGNGTSELYSANADGSALRRLTWTSQTEQAPAWAPDGTRIAYESSLGGRYHVWVMNSDGSGQTQLTSSGDDEDPAWSADGTQIAFGSTRTGNWTLWVMNADGTGQRQVSTVFGDDPAWSPDGRRLAYLGLEGIGVVGVDGSDPHVVSLPGAPASAPSWSPDGTQIVFSRNNAAGYPGELFVANADGSGEHQLTGDGYLNARPSWSPDGTQVVFQRSASPSSGWGLWAIGVDGAGLRQVTSSGNALGPDWGSSQVIPEPSPPDAPVIQIYSPDPATLYLPTSQAPAFYVCSSYVSFIVSCDGDVPFGAPLDFTQAGMHTFTVRAVDAEGRTSTASVTYQVFDFVPPQIDVRSPSDGATYELGAYVTVDFSCSDPKGTGVLYCAGDLPVGAPLDTRQPGTYTFQVVAFDNSHNLSQVKVTYTVVDSRPPTIQIASPGNGAAYTLGDTVPSAYSCAASAGAHIVTCAGPVASGSALDTSTVGAKTFTVNASDDRGKSASLTQAYTVVYPFAGFDSPVSSSGSIDTARAGDSVPLKFSLRGDRGLGAVRRTTSQPVSCTSWTSLGDAATAQAKLSYSASSDRYLDVVGTDPGWKGACRTIDVELADGTHHPVRVHFTK